MKLKLNLYQTLVLTGLIALSALADAPKESAKEEAKPATAPTTPDMAKVSYAMGMNMAMEFKENKLKLDPEVVEQAVKDVMQGKPTELKDADILNLLKQTRTTPLAKLAEDDPHKVSYALGMQRAVQLKRSGAEIDSQEFGQGLRDMLEDKPTKVPQTDIPTLFHQAQAYTQAQLAKRNQSEGAAFLAKNAKAPGITVLPSGLQYRVLKTGAGKAPSTNDLIFIKYRGSFVDGREFDHHNQWLTQTTGGIKGWQEALQRMHVGDKWQLFIPSEIGFGHSGEAVKGVGPDATLVYEMELSEIVPPTDPRVGTGRVGHGMDGDNPEPEPSGK